MTDDERDELATAYLDGECTAEERRQVDNDPDLRARVSELAAVRSVVGGPVRESPAERREEIIAAALAEFGRLHGTEAPPSLTAARVAKGARPIWTRLAPLGAVAAVLVVVVGSAVALRDRDSGSDADDATAAGQTAEESGTELAVEPPLDTALTFEADDTGETARDEATTFEAAPEATPDTEAAGGAEAALPSTEAGSATTAAAETTAAATGDGADQPLQHVCDAAVREIDPDLGELAEVTDAEGSDGRQKLAYALLTDPAERRTYEVDPPTCTDIVLLEQDR